MRYVAPPQPVTVDLARGVIQCPDDGFAGQVSLRLRKDGLNVGGRAEGLLLAWVRSVGGSWRGVIRLHTNDRHGSLTTLHLCPLKSPVRWKIGSSGFGPCRSGSEGGHRVRLCE
jgi:hypothetical protein